jgi:hypothetical protein
MSIPIQMECPFMVSSPCGVLLDGSLARVNSAFDVGVS